MGTHQGRERIRVRTLFVSDLHLGFRHARVQEFLGFLEHFQPAHLYLVGDIIDGWKLRRSFRWEPLFNEVLSRLYELHEEGTCLFYAPGNHDEFLRRFRWDFGFVRVADEFVYEAGDGRRYLVTHGDRYDRVECGARWLSVVASIGYDSLLSVSRHVCRWRGGGLRGHYAFSAAVKQRVKQVVRYISDFEQRLMAAAATRRCDGVICGHVHTPQLRWDGPQVYVNLGDWVENCTAFVEYETGECALLRCVEGEILVEQMLAPTRVVACTSPHAEPHSAAGCQRRATA
uniref:UDP-2,3-diacylglucosamine diphosphatase n=1 Tax=Schlesneria paludicola TaxID=360056 RepID=A0A7C4QLS8_9PLAN